MNHALRSASLLAGGKKVTVVSDGKTFELDAGLDETPAKENTLARLVIGLLEADKRKSEEVQRLSDELKDMRAAMDGNNASIQSMVDADRVLLEAIKSLDATLRLPVIGVRENGRLIARRSEK